MVDKAREKAWKGNNKIPSSVWRMIRRCLESLLSPIHQGWLSARDESAFFNLTVKASVVSFTITSIYPLPRFHFFFFLRACLFRNWVKRLTGRDD